MVVQEHPLVSVDNPPARAASVRRPGPCVPQQRDQHLPKGLRQKSFLPLLWNLPDQRWLVPGPLPRDRQCKENHKIVFKERATFKLVSNHTKRSQSPLRRLTGVIIFAFKRRSCEGYTKQEVKKATSMNTARFLGSLSVATRTNQRCVQGTPCFKMFQLHLFLGV